MKIAVLLPRVLMESVQVAIKDTPDELEVKTINRKLRLAILNNGDMHKIACFIDIDGNETEDHDEAIACVVKGQRRSLDYR